MSERIFEGYGGYPLHLCLWDNVEKPKAVIIVAHGMFEHGGRYKEFAEFMNANDYIVAILDLRCMGKTAGKQYGLVLEGNCFNNTVQDLLKLSKEMRVKYNVPQILYGYDYGSVLAQKVMECASEVFDIVIVTGIMQLSATKVSLVKMINNISATFCKKDKPSKLLSSMWYKKLNKVYAKDIKSGGYLSRDIEQVKDYNADSLCYDKQMSIQFYRQLFGSISGLYCTKALSCIRKELPILILTGDAETRGVFRETVKELYDDYTENAISNVKLKVYKDARHALHMEINRLEVFGDIAEYLDATLKTI